MAEAEVAVIGGSGFYQMQGLGEREELRLTTPFGDPSDRLALGMLGGRRVVFLPRHGIGHRLLPSEVPVRANIYALKTLGVQRIISINAVGSLREEIAPRHLAVPDQLIDRTRGRPGTFFGRGITAHISFAEPFCSDLSAILVEAARTVGVAVHEGGTMVVIEGPQFSTKAESELYRSWGASFVGMTGIPEAKLAREAEMCYASLSCVTDYDVWRESTETVTAEMILENLARNVKAAQQVVALTVERLPPERTCPCADALSNALVTSPELVPEQVKRELAPIIGRYMPVRSGRGANG